LTIDLRLYGQLSRSALYEYTDRTPSLRRLYGEGKVLPPALISRGLDNEVVNTSHS